MSRISIDLIKMKLQQTRPRMTLTGVNKRKASAVLIPVCLKHGEPAVLFTKRSSLVGSHQGQVSFPGGRVEPSDASLIDTALRETFEETGISRDNIEVLATLNDAYAKNGDVVTPVVGVIEAKFWSAYGQQSSTDVVDAANRFAPLRISEAEIDDIMVLSLSELCDPQRIGWDDFGLRAKIPHFTAGPYRVWGLTAHFLYDFLQTIGVWPFETSSRRPS